MKKMNLRRTFGILLLTLCTLFAGCHEEIELPASVKSVSLDQTMPITLTVGEETTLTATVLPANAVNKLLTWSASPVEAVRVEAIDNTKVRVIALAEVDQPATVTVTTIDGSFTATCTVTVKPLPSYGISLDITGNQPFGEAAEGYDPLTAKTITITNTSNLPIGTLTIALSGANAGSFTVSPASIPGLAVGATGTFTVVPKPGLTPGSYTAIVTVSGENGISAGFTVSFRVSNHAVSLSQTDEYSFPEASKGYGEQTPKEITVTNAGNSPTGALTVALSGVNASDYFSVTPTTIPSIATGGTATFSVKPKTGLDEGTYTATVTVSGANGISESFDVSFEVTDYSISLSQTDDYTFVEATEGYGDQTPLTVTVTGTGTRATGALSVALSGDDAASFTVDPTTIPSLDPADDATFTVVPNTGLATGDYSATVTVSGENGISESFDVAFAVNSYAITLSQTDPYAFPEATKGYGDQTPKEITVTNAGNKPTGALTVALSGDDATDFTLSKTAIPSIGTGDDDSFTVVPKTGLEAGDYTATVTVSGENGISESFDVSFTVNVTALLPGPAVNLDGLTVGVVITPIDLSDQVSGGTPPYTFALTGGDALPAGISLNGTTGVISGTPTAIAAAGTATVTVSDSHAPTPQSETIDVNFSVVTGPLVSQFTVANANGSGDIFYKKQTGLVARDMQVTNHLYSENISASYLNKTGGEVIIPATVAYGDNTYNVVRVGYSAFRNCAITSITLPEGITSFGGAAFFGCEQLTKINIPAAVTNIELNAMAKCPKLTDLYVYWSDPTVCGIQNGDYGMLGNTTSKAAITLHVPAGTTAAYRAHAIWGEVGHIVEDATPAPAIVASGISGGGKSGTSSWALDANGRLTIAGKGTMAKSSWNSGLGAQVKSIVINEGITTIANDAIYYCENIEQLYIPASVTSMGSVSYGVKRNPTVTVAAGNTKLFADASGALYSREAGNTYKLFSIPTLLAGQYTILDGTTTMDTGAIKGFSALTKLTIPASVASFGTYCFEYITSLTDLVVNWTNPATAPQPTNLTEANITLHVPAASVGAYSAIPYWNSFKAIVAQPAP